ncbi:MAG: hypothetical protein ACR2Q4_07310 [Geminicoccaceae bacterium]
MRCKTSPQQFLLGVITPIIAAAAISITTPSPAAIGGAGSTDAMIEQAFRYIGVISGQGLGADDKAWLREHWEKRGAQDLAAMAAQIEDDPDPLTLALLRSRMIDEIYCAAERTTDPVAHRLRAILAPDDLVLAADCIFDFVVTRFDLEGTVASHAVVAGITDDVFAEVTGSAYDRPGDLAANQRTITSRFAEMDLKQQAFIASGEVRHAVAARFWSRLEGDTRRPEVAAALVRDVREADGNLWQPARSLESLASAELGQVDYIVEVEGVRLTAADVAAYRKWWEGIAGYQFSLRDHAWIENLLIKAYRQAPINAQKRTDSVRAYHQAILSADDPDRKAALLAAEEARIYCHLQASSERQDSDLGELLFRHDPVTESDCANDQVTRWSDTVLAKAGERVITEAHVSEIATYLDLVLARAPTSNERAFLREREIRAFKEDPETWQAGLEQTRGLMADYRSKGQLAFLMEAIRLKELGNFYCHVRQSGKPGHAGFVAMLQQTHEIVFEDCDRRIVTTRRAVDSYVEAVNFIAHLAGLPLLSADDETTIRGNIKGSKLDAEADLATLMQWWSWLSPEKKKREVAKIRNDGLRRANDVIEKLEIYVDVAGIGLVSMEAKIRSCAMLAVIERGAGDLLIAGSGPQYGQNLESRPLGIDLGRLARLQSLGSFFSALCT